MSSKPLWKVSITTSPEAEDLIQELLAGAFNQAVAAYTNLETRRTEVTAYLDAKPNSEAKVLVALKAGLAEIKKCGLNVGEAEILVTKVRREDWAESWKRHFRPIAVGKTLLIKPSWSRVRRRKGRKVVVLDPGLSFGTGQHPTTGFCLAELVRYRNRDESQALLDVGTGSGILAVAAAKLGYRPVEAFDFDPEAVRVARANARKNRVENKIRLFRQDLTRLPVKAAKKYSVICANLISNLLLFEQRRLLSRLQPEGALVIAGILEKEFAQIQRAYENAGMRLVASRVEGEWCSGAFLWKRQTAV